MEANIIELRSKVFVVWGLSECPVEGARRRWIPPLQLPQRLASNPHFYEPFERHPDG